MKGRRGRREVERVLSACRSSGVFFPGHKKTGIFQRPIAVFTPATLAVFTSPTSRSHSGVPLIVQINCTLIHHNNDSKLCTLTKCIYTDQYPCTAWCGFRDQKSLSGQKGHIWTSSHTVTRNNCAFKECFYKGFSYGSTKSLDACSCLTRRRLWFRRRRSCLDRRRAAFARYFVSFKLLFLFVSRFFCVTCSLAR